VASGMMWAVNEALRVYYDAPSWERVIKNGMAADFSWDRSAEKYTALYEKLKSGSF
jgi:starch synthase